MRESDKGLRVSVEGMKRERERRNQERETEKEIQQTPLRGRQRVEVVFASGPPGVGQVGAHVSGGVVVHFGCFWLNDNSCGPPITPHPLTMPTITRSCMEEWNTHNIINIRKCVVRERERQRERERERERVR